MASKPTEIIISTELVLGSSPRLDGHRLDVRHVIYGLIKEPDRYQKDFGVSKEQVRHAIMYCKDQMCEKNQVPQSCSWCSKQFAKDKLYYQEYSEDEENDELKDGWKDAQKLYDQCKDEFNLPNSYLEIIQENSL